MARRSARRSARPWRISSEIPGSRGRGGSCWPAPETACSRRRRPARRSAGGRDRRSRAPPGWGRGVGAGRLVRADADAWAGRLDAALAAIGDVARHVEPSVEALARELDGADTIWVLGGGPSRGTADYLAAKFHEQLPWNGIAQDLEEWAHLQYFLTLAWKARSVVVVLAPPGNALDRAEELVQGIAAAGGRAVVVGPPAPPRLPGAHAR